MENENDSDDSFRVDATVLRSNAIFDPLSNLTNYLQRPMCESKRLKCDSDETAERAHRVSEFFHLSATSMNASKSFNDVNCEQIDDYQSPIEDSASSPK